MLKKNLLMKQLNMEDKYYYDKIMKSKDYYIDSEDDLSYEEILDEEYEELLRKRGYLHSDDYVFDEEYNSAEILKDKFFKNIDVVINLAYLANDPLCEVNARDTWEIGPLSLYQMM